MAKILLSKFPQWTDENVAEISGLTVAAVKKLRAKWTVPKNVKPNGQSSDNGK